MYKRQIELRSDFMTESFVDRYLPGDLVFSKRFSPEHARIEGLQIHRAGFASTIKVRASCRVRRKYCIVQDGVRDTSWRTRSFAIHTDPTVVLCNTMMSRALSALHLVSERFLPLSPTCTVIFAFFL